MKKVLTLVFAILSLQAHALTYSQHYNAVRETLLRVSPKNFSEDAAVVLSSAIWLGVGGDRGLCGTMLGIVVTEGGLTPNYDWQHYLSHAGLRPSTAIKIGKLTPYSKDEWLKEMRANPAWATVKAGRWFIHLRVAWRTTDNAVRDWNVGPEWRTKYFAKGELYLRKVSAVRRAYEEELQKK